MNMVDQGLAVYDGVMMGMRVARNIRRNFWKTEITVCPKKPFHKIAGKKHCCPYRYDPPPTLGFVKSPFIFQFEH